VKHIKHLAHQTGRNSTDVWNLTARWYLLEDDAY
jgi:hypothetical protein